MFCNFKQITLDDVNNVVAVEPPAGILPAIIKRLELFSNENGDLNSVTYKAIYLLTCIHVETDDKLVSVVTLGFRSLAELPDTTLVNTFLHAENEVFVKLVEWFTLQVNKNTLDSWFSQIDQEFFFTEVTKQTEKND